MFCLPLSTFAQINEDFSDGDLTNNPTWEGQPDSFQINNDFQMQLNANVAGNSTLYLPINIPDSMFWNMWFKMDFAPSNQNALKIYLWTNQTNLEAGDGYFLDILRTE